MRVKIRYKVNGREYDEEIIDLVIYNKAGENILYAYSTLDGSDDEGVCIVRPGMRIEDGFLVFPKPQCTCCKDSDCKCCHTCAIHGTINKKEG